MKTKKRLWNKLLAKLRGRFWTLCPRCHRPFGGHEAHGQHAVFHTEEGPQNYRIVCKHCLAEGSQPKALPSK